MKNHGFSQFPKVSWEIWVRISSTPQVMCRPTLELFPPAPRFQQELLKYRADYQDFASPRAGPAAKILDDERRCLDNFLSQARQAHSVIPWGS